MGVLEQFCFQAIFQLVSFYVRKIFQKYFESVKELNLDYLPVSGSICFVGVSFDMGGSGFGMFGCCFFSVVQMMIGRNIQQQRGSCKQNSKKDL